MKILFDENFPIELSRSIHNLQLILNKKRGIQVEVGHFKDVFYRGIPDPEWIPLLEKHNAVAVTQDYQIYRNRHIRDLCKRHDAGIVFIRPPKGYPFWDTMMMIYKKWQDINDAVLGKRGTLFFEVTPRTARELQ